MIRSASALPLALMALAFSIAPFVCAAGPDAVVGERVKKLNRAAQWRAAASIPVSFNTHHPQGMVKIGDVFFVSSVEIRTPTKRFAQPQNGYDRDTGEGAAH